MIWGVALASVLSTSGYTIQEDNFFDTISIKADSDLREKVKSFMESAGYNFGIAETV